MEFYEVLEMMFGQMHFFAAMGNRNFAEIHMEGNEIIVEITNLPVFLEAMLIHVFKKERFTSRKLADLKKAGYRITLRYRNIETNI